MIINFKVGKRVLMALVIGLLAVWLVPLLDTSAAGPGTSADAVALAAAHPAFAAYLAAYQGWKADAYYTANSFKIWRVEFWDKDGETIGWANVSLERKKVYSYEVHYAMSDAQKKAGEDAALKFVKASAEVREVVGNFDDYEPWLDYNREGGLWIVAFSQSGQTVAAAVKFEDPINFKKPTLYGIYFPEVMSFAEWQQAQKAQVATIAFKQAEIAAVLRDKPGWTTTISKQKENVYNVIFMFKEKAVAKAVVDTSTQSVVSFELVK